MYVYGCGTNSMNGAVDKIYSVGVCASLGLLAGSWSKFAPTHPAGTPEPFNWIIIPDNLINYPFVLNS